MSFFSLPRGTFRKFPKQLKLLKKGQQDEEFVPNSMIDTLFDYGAFLQSADKNKSIARKSPARKKKVAIIGAGASGLVAAYELSRVKNISVSLFEAADRAGGRMHSILVPDTPHQDKVFEMGCMRFPPTSYTLFHYLNKFNLKPVPNFPDPGHTGVPTKLLYENRVINWPAGTPTPADKDFQRIGRDFGAMLTYLLGDANQPDTGKPNKLYDFWAIYQQKPTKINKKGVIKAWQKMIIQYRNVTYYKAVYDLGQNTKIVQQKWTQEDMNKFGALGVGSGGFGPLYGVNFLDILRLFANAWEDKQELLQSGIISLVDAFLLAIEQGVVLISYVWGDDSSKLLALSPEERYQQFLLAIEKIDPVFAQLLDEQREKLSYIDWENTTNMYGAFKLNYPGQEQANHDAYFQFQAKNQGLFLAGDSISWAGGWLEGAMPTGVNAACAAAQHLGSELIPKSPLTEIPAAMYKYE